MPRLKCNETYHVLPPLHKLLVDYFAGIVLSSLDMYRFLDDSIRPTAQSLPRSILDRCTGE